MGLPRLDEYGLSEAIVDEIRARERRQFELVLKMTGGGVAALWLVLTFLVYSHSSRQAPLLGLVAAPLLALLGAVIGSLPIAVVFGLGCAIYGIFGKDIARYRGKGDTGDAGDAT